MDTYFLSSNYSSLQTERQEVINALRDTGNSCLSMEGFTFSSDEQGFEEIKRLIDHSDVLLLLIGDTYGSTDKNGISWTQREFIYAGETEKTICAVKLHSFEVLEKLGKEHPESLNDEQRAQLDFGKTITFASNASSGIYSTVVRYNRNRIIQKEVQWKNRYKHLDFNGDWYSVHTSRKDKKYLRIGTVKIRQQFNSAGYRELSAEADNYGVAADETGMLIFDGSGDICLNEKHTYWYADYEIYAPDGRTRIVGVFASTHEYTGTFDNAIDSQPRVYGVHEFVLGTSWNGTRLEGTFRNCASEIIGSDPTNKAGQIVLFRDKKERDRFVAKKIKDKEVILDGLH